MQAIKFADIASHRLSNQQITATEIREPAEMVRWFGAIQGQEYLQSKWALGLRLPRLKDEDIERALQEGKILRTHLLRPTWHFVAAEDIRWLLMLTAPRVHAVNGFMYRKLELERKLLDRCSKIIVNALEGGRNLTRDDLKLELRKKKIEVEGFRSAYIMMYAELEGIICSGPRQGNQHTYMLLSERVPTTKPKSRDEALLELARRYFTSRGPATVKDFSTWSAFTIADCKKAIDMLKPSIADEFILNDRYFYFTNSSATQTKQSMKIHLLPVYDEYIMGYKNRDAISMLFKAVPTKVATPFDSTIILDGQVAGTWKRTIRNKSIILEYEVFVPVDQKIKDRFNNAVARFKEFTAMDSHLTLRAVSIKNIALP